jgi:hypothetical protein
MSDELPETDPGMMKVMEALETLREHFDSCHICCTRYYRTDGSGFTDTISFGSGNYSARYGSLSETVIKMEEDMRDKRRATE